MILVICGFAATAGAQTKLITFRSAPGSPYGYDAAGGADFNGDGWPDIALPIQVQWGNGVTFSGRNGAALFPLGSPAGFGSTAAWTKTSVGNAGDFDGDGYQDVIQGLPEQEDYLGDIPSMFVVYSGFDGSAIVYESYTFHSPVGTAVDGAGDLNADGYDDVIASWGVGAFPNGVIGIGGPSANLLFTLNGVGNQALGASLAGLGDIDLDGIPDFVAGAPFANKAFVYSGAAPTFLYALSDPSMGGNFGASVARVGDINGDGIRDIAVGSGFLWFPAFGGVSIFSGANGALLRSTPEPVPGSYFGRSVAGIGDIDGDGFPDYAAGAPFEPLGPLQKLGAARFFSGANGSVISTLRGSAAGDRLGMSIAGANDFNLDGVPDALVVAPRNDDFFPTIGSDAIVYSFASGLQQFEPGVAGCFGANDLNVNDLPRVGTSPFEFRVTHAPISNLGLLVIADAAVASPVDSFGIDLPLLLDFPGSSELIPIDLISDDAGFALGATSIPNIPGIAGLVRHAQAIFYWSSGPCAPTTFALSASHRLTITIQP